MHRSIERTGDSVIYQCFPVLKAEVGIRPGLDGSRVPGGSVIPKKYLVTFTQSGVLAQSMCNALHRDRILREHPIQDDHDQAAARFRHCCADLFVAASRLA